MGRVLQKKKNKSSIPKVRAKKKTKSARPRLILSNPIIAANWCKTQTLSQNYRRLGLTSNLNAPTGGTEPSSTLLSHNTSHLSSSSSQNKNQHDALSVAAYSRSSKVLIPSTVRIQRDPHTGAIRKILRSSPPPPGSDPNPLGDPLNALDDFELEAKDREGEDGDAAGPRGIVAQLEEKARMMGAGPKRVRPQSKYEREWVERLVERWGDDVRAMARDRRLNPRQQSEGDLRRRIRRWREAGGGKEEIVGAG